MEGGEAAPHTWRWRKKRCLKIVF